MKSQKNKTTEKAVGNPEPKIVIGTPEQAVWKSTLDDTSAALAKNNVTIKIQEAVIKMAKEELKDLNLD